MSQLDNPVIEIETAPAVQHDTFSERYTIGEYQARYFVGDIYHGFKGKHSKFPSSTNSVLVLHVDEQYHAHVELRFEIPLKPELRDPGKRIAESVSVVFYGTTTITSWREQDQNSFVGKHAATKEDVERGNISCVTITWDKRPMCQGIWGLLPDVVPENFDQVRTYIKGTLRGPGQTTLLVRWNYEDPEQCPEQIKKVNDLMAVQRGQYALPYLRFHAEQATESGASAHTAI